MKNQTLAELIRGIDRDVKALEKANKMTFGVLAHKAVEDVEAKLAKYRK